MATLSPWINGQSKAGRNTKKMQKKTLEAWGWTWVREYKDYSKRRGMTNQSSTKLTRKKNPENKTKPTKERKKINKPKTQIDSFCQNQVTLTTCVNLHAAAKSDMYEDKVKQSRLREGRSLYSKIDNLLWPTVIGDYSLKHGRMNPCHSRGHIAIQIC